MYDYRAQPQEYIPTEKVNNVVNKQQIKQQTEHLRSQLDSVGTPKPHNTSQFRAQTSLDSISTCASEQMIIYKAHRSTQCFSDAIQVLPTKYLKNNQIKEEKQC